MLSTLRKTIVKHHMLTPGDAVLVGLSGGADSVALLHGLLSLREALSLTLAAAHVNHHLRGNDAQADEDFVVALCQEWGVPLKIFQIDVLSNLNGQTVEEAARRLRYACLTSSQLAEKSSKIATAHNQDDNAETVLLNLIRGTGLKGLCGIPPVRPLGSSTLIRPLIETPRSAIETYTKQHNLSYRTDASNYQVTYTRNRVRHSLLPSIEQINPHARSVIARNTATLRDEEDYLATLAKEAYSQCLTDKGIEIKKLSALPIVLQRRVIRLACHPGQNITAKHVEQILQLTHKQTGSEISLPSGLTVRVEYGFLCFCQQYQQAADGFCYPLHPEQPLFIPPLKKTVLLTLHPPKDCSMAFSYDKVRTSLCLRSRLPGDRIYLKGTGTRKLQDYFTDAKIPRSQRDSIPLLADGRAVLWIMDKNNRVNSQYEAQAGCTPCWILLNLRNIN